MRARILGITAIASLVAISGLFMACGGDDDSGGSSGDGSSATGQAGGPVDLAGAIVPDTFLTYDGEQYELKDILQADLVDESEFTEAGEASAIDVDGDPTVYTREGDSTAVYTFYEGSGSGEEAVPDNWYQWKPVE